LAVADNATNTHQEGAAQYAAGSVKELLSQYTDVTVPIVPHFDEVHPNKIKKGCTHSM
jgi:hypothetical protein